MNEPTYGSFYCGARDPYKFLKQLAGLTEALALGQRVIVFSSTPESSKKFRQRIAQSGLFNLLTVQEVRSDEEIRFVNGAVLKYSVVAKRDTALRGFEGQVIVEEMPT